MSVLTFEQFLRSAADKGEGVNILFEERLFGLVGVLHKIALALEEGRVDYELIGGLAVFVHVDEVSPEHATLISTALRMPQPKLASAFDTFGASICCSTERRIAPGTRSTAPNDCPR